MLEFLENYWSLIVAGVVVIVAIVTLIIVTRTSANASKNAQVAQNDADASVEDNAEPVAEKESAEVEAEPAVEESEIVEETEVEEQEAEESADDEDADAEESEEESTEDDANDEEVDAEEVEEAEGDATESEPAVESAKATKKTTVIYHVIYDKDAKEWLVRKNNSKRASKKARTKSEALELAQQLCANNNGTLRVHKRDGKFQKNTTKK